MGFGASGRVTFWGPRGPQDGPSQPQDDSKTVHNGSESPKNRPKMLKITRRRAKRPPRRSKKPPRGVPRGPREAKIIDFSIVFERFGGFRVFRLPTLQDGPRGSEDNPKTAQEASETVPIPPRTAPRRQEKRPIQKPTFASHAASQRRNIRVREPERSYFIPARAWLDRAVGLCGLRLRATFGSYVWGLSFRSFRLGATFGGFRFGAFVWGLRLGAFVWRLSFGGSGVGAFV